MNAMPLPVLLAVDEDPDHLREVDAQLAQRYSRDYRVESLGDAEVVADQVVLRQPVLWEEELVRIRDRDLVAADAHFVEVTAPERAKPAFVAADGLLLVPV